jgi:hypothetical protein
MIYFIIADATGYGNYVKCDRVNYLDNGWVKFLSGNFVEAAISPGFPGYVRQITEEQYSSRVDEEEEVNE